MSASPMARQVTETKAIPIKRVALMDPSDLPADYSSTPGGTLYSTTPGGTKIVYDRSFLMNLRNSPVSRTPPTCDIPEILQKGSKVTATPKSKPKPSSNHAKTNHISNVADDGQEQFEMDM